MPCCSRLDPKQSPTAGPLPCTCMLESMPLNPSPATQLSAWPVTQQNSCQQQQSLIPRASLINSRCHASSTVCCHVLLLLIGCSMSIKPLLGHKFSSLLKTAARVQEPLPFCWLRLLDLGQSCSKPVKSLLQVSHGRCIRQAYAVWSSKGIPRYCCYLANLQQIPETMQSSTQAADSMCLPQRGMCVSRQSHIK